MGPESLADKVRAKYINNIFIQQTLDSKLAQFQEDEINSPPIEPSNPHLLNNPRLKFLNTVVTDEMIL